MMKNSCLTSLLLGSVTAFLPMSITLANVEQLSRAIVFTDMEVDAMEMMPSDYQMGKQDWYEADLFQYQSGHTAINHSYPVSNNSTAHNCQLTRSIVITNQNSEGIAISNSQVAIDSQYGESCF